MSSERLDDDAREGIETMEREHALETRMVRELQSALAASDRAAADTLFDRLEELTEAHFLAEQLIMRLHAYPAYAAHQEEHDRLIGELRDLRASLDAAEPTDPVGAVARLERWLHAHMQSEDAALADFLRQGPTDPLASRGRRG